MAPLEGLAVGTAEYERARAEVVQELRGRRNQLGGYWVAKDDPRAAIESVVGSIRLSDIASFALFSNGASRVVDPYALVTWPDVMRLLYAEGPPGLLQKLRDHEGRNPGAQAPDDASVVFGTPRHRRTTRA